jgi:hypothetical protein
MSAEERLRTKATEATGDETIVDVAIFHPRGWAGAMGAGAAAGSALGGDSALGSMAGAAAGGMVAAKVSGAARDLPQSTCVAVAPEKVYLMAHRGATDFAGDVDPPFATLERSQLGVEVHQRALNRVVVLHDGATDESFPFEAPRFGPYHAKAIVQLLLMSPEHLDEAVPSDE